MHKSVVLKLSIFYRNFLILCNRNKVAPSRVAEECDATRASSSRWKSGVIPRDATLLKIADYFNVPVEMLTQEGAFDDGLPEKPDAAQLEAVQDAVEDNARAARRCQIIDRTAGMTLAQLEQIVGLLDVMFPAEG